MTSFVGYDLLCAGVSYWAKQCIHYFSDLGRELKFVEEGKE